MTKKKRKSSIKPVHTYEEFIKKLESYKETLCSSPFFDRLLEDLKKCFQDLAIENIEQIICYGLGHFTECLIAKYQLALLLLFQSRFGSKIYIYDPIFSTTEIEFLKKLELLLIDDNEEGARDIDSISLIYMPHCPTALVNNLLWKNWSPMISNCIILGNSFQSLATSQPERKFRERFSYIHSALSFTKELEIANVFKYSDIFNDMSVHYFPLLSDLPETFWENKKKPMYEDADIECISNKLKNSTIK